MRLSPPLLIAAALAAPGLCAAADIVDLAWDARGVSTHTVDVAPGKFAEACGALPPGTRVAWRFESSAPLDFNIHYHVGKDVHYPAKATQVRTADGVLAVAAREDQCWMWTNKGGEAVRLEVSLTRLP